MSPASIYVSVYVGQTRAKGWINRLEALGFGEMCNRGELPPRRNPWAFDNGAFKDWNEDRPKDTPDADWMARRGPMRPEDFQAARYEQQLDFLRLHVNGTPDFLVVPDLVAGGMKSFEFSLSWVPKVRRLAPLYLAVQDGMAAGDIAPHLADFAGLFVGGSKQFKKSTGAFWCSFAHSYGMKCHIGRVGSMKAALWARGCGADSIDSCLPLWGEDNLRVFLEGLRRETNSELVLESRPAHNKGGEA